MHAHLHIQEGDWFVTKRTAHDHRNKPRPRCFEYCVKPAEGWGLPAETCKVSLEPLPLGSYTGPVHGKAEYFKWYTTVRVPSRSSAMLVWVNISWHNVQFAQKADGCTIRKWKQKGWRDHFYPDMNR